MVVVVVGFDRNGDGWFPFYMRNLSFPPSPLLSVSLSFSFFLFLTLPVFFLFIIIYLFSVFEFQFGLGLCCVLGVNCSVSDNLQNVRGILEGFGKCLRGPCGVLFFSGYVNSFQNKLTNLPSPNFGKRAFCSFISK